LYFEKLDINLANCLKLNGASLTFKLVINHKEDNLTDKVILIAASSIDKAAWTSDISQVKKN